MPIRLNSANSAGINRANGFTIIEIVLVLLLLGILGAAAVPKYFDIQETAHVTVCNYNRQVIVNSVVQQEMLARYANDPKIFDYTSKSGALSSAQSILDEMYPADHKETACPSGGRVTLQAVSAGKVGFFFTASCSIHTKTSMIVTREDGTPFIEWFKGVFHDPMALGSYTSLSDLFVRETGAELDSEAGGFKNTLTGIVAQALSSAGVDFENVIWRVSRENWKGCRNGINCRGTIDFLFANSSDATAANKNQLIDAHKYSLTVIYDAAGKATFQTSESMVKAMLLMKNEGNPNKNNYWVLQGI